MTQAEGRWDVILTRPVAETLARHADLPPLPDGLGARWETLARYPDGALEVPVVGGVGLYELDAILQGAGVPSLFSSDNPDFDSPSQFPACHVTLVLDDAYQQRLPQPGVDVWVTEHLVRGAAPGRLDHLRVLVMFARRVLRKTRRDFTLALDTWAEGVAVSGVLGDGPASLSGNRVTFDGLGAEFHVDLSRSGQATLNWLILSLLNFGHDDSMVQGILLGEDGLSDFEVNVLGFPAGRPITLTVSRSPLASSESPDGGPALDSQSDPLFSSSRFRVLNTPGFRWEDAWDHLQTTIYFATVPPADVVSELSELLRGYLSVGRYGGLGSGVIGGYSEISVDRSTGLSRFTADMDEADIDRAIPLLIRLLEHFNPKMCPIDAVLFGRRIATGPQPTDSSIHVDRGTPGPAEPGGRVTPEEQSPE